MSTVKTDNLQTRTGSGSIHIPSGVGLTLEGGDYNLLIKNTNNNIAIHSHTGTKLWEIDNNGSITHVGPNHDFTTKVVNQPITDSQSGTSPDVSNSTSDQLAIYNGSTKLWGINESGYVVNPNVPSFFAWDETGSSTVTGSQGTNLDFGDTLFNNGGHYSTTTYRFTAPINGIYKFTGSALYRQSSSNASAEITFYKNGAVVVNRGLGYAYFGQTSSNYHGQVTIDCLLNLSAGDYVYPAIWALSSGDWYKANGLGWFSGFLIG